MSPAQIAEAQRMAREIEAEVSGSLGVRGEVREPDVRRAGRQGEEQIGQGDVGPEPRDHTVTAVASGSIATRAFDADDVQGKFAQRM